jgi:ribosomal protein L1
MENNIKDIMEKAVQKISLDLERKLEELVFAALEAKGFKFDNTVDLITFLGERCKIIDHVQAKEKVYYVDQIPFFLHRYEVMPELSNLEGGSVKMIANFGSYTNL